STDLRSAGTDDLYARGPDRAECHACPESLVGQTMVRRVLVLDPHFKVQALSLVASEAVSAAAVLPGITPVSRPLNIQPFRVQRVPIGRQQVECVRGAHENILRPLETRIGDVEGMDLDRRRDRYRSGM